MRSLVFNGWAAGPETWELCSFPHDWVFSYLEEMEGLHEKVIRDFDEVVLVGFSMGGSFALKTLLKYPEKVKGLVLISATPRMTSDPATDWAGMSERRLKAFLLGTEMLFRDDPSPLYAPENMRRGLEYLGVADLRPELKALGKTDFPVAIFQSERDGIVRPNNATFLKEIFPQAKVTMVAGNEHVLPIKVPELIDQAVNDILESV